MRALTLAMVTCLAAISAACGGSTNEPSPTVTALAITGTSLVPAVGQTSQLTLTATLSSGGSQVVTNQAVWQSSNTGVATVSPAGLATAQGYGAANITASYQGTSGTLTFVVTLAGTWIANGPEGTSVRWNLTQSQGLVAGTFALAPVVPGNGLSVATVGGVVSGSTFVWTMTGTVGGDTGHPECVGTTPIIAGVGQIASGGASMIATVQSISGVCNPRLAPIFATGASITFSKQ